MARRAHHCDAPSANPSYISNVDDLYLPPEQRDRQAVASLGGYLHQIIQSVSAWMRLKGNEELLLEVAEDFAVLAPQALQMTQVKHERPQSSVTLRSEGSRKAIISLWQFSQANPGLEVRLIYLTTARAGKEKGASLPGDVCGIAYWRLAAGGADVEPLRRLLLELDLPDDLTTFLRDAPAEALRQRLLKRLHWATEAEKMDQAADALRDRLQVVAGDRGLMASDAEAAYPALIVKVLETAVSSERILTRGDFESCWERATSVSIGRGQLRQLLAEQMGASQSLKPRSQTLTPPLPARLTRRTRLVTVLRDALAQNTALWLYGSSGLGKTMLARLVVDGASDNWPVVRLRGLDAKDAVSVLRETLPAVSQPAFAGIILDDVPLPLSEPLRSWIVTAANEVSEAGGKLIVTSEREPLVGTRLELEPCTIAAQVAPYLTVEDVSEIVRSAGGDPATWAGLIHLTCGLGHPLLVDARVAGLALRGWPADEQLDGLLGNNAGEVADIRTDVARRLFEELSEDAHSLLLRLSVLNGTFDRELALTLAEVVPPVRRAGAVFDSLVGPWIEAKESDRFTLSPLVATAGFAGLGPGERNTVHNAVVDQLLTRNSFPADLLGQVLQHALITRHLQGLDFVGQVILSGLDRRVIVQACPMLPFLKSSPNGLLVPEKPMISATLRLAQVLAAVAWGEQDLLARTIEDAKAEFATRGEPLVSGFAYTMLNAVLGDEALLASPSFWMPLLIEYNKLMASGGVPTDLTDALSELDLGGLTPEEFFFSFRSNKIDRPEKLAELFTALAPLPSDYRHKLLGGSTKLLGGPPLFIRKRRRNPALRVVKRG